MIELTDLERLRAIGLAPHILSSLPEVHADDTLMRVVEVQRDSVMLHDGDARRARARAAGAARRARQRRASPSATGSIARRNPLAEWWVHARVPPANQIARRLHDGRDKVTRVVLVANVDTVLIVMGLDHDFNPRRLERYLAFTRLARVGAVVVLTKADLVSDDERARARARGAVAGAGRRGGARGQRPRRRRRRPRSSPGSARGRRWSSSAPAAPARAR